MWLCPSLAEGGQNKVALVLEHRDGTALWRREFAEIQLELGLGRTHGFDLMIKRSSTKLVRDIAHAVSCEEFKAALSKA